MEAKKFEKKDFRKELHETCQKICAPGKGLLAADESHPTLGKKFDKCGIPNEEENRRAYRQMLFTAPDLEKYISGVILFKETAQQKTKDGVQFPELLAKRGIVPGIKVDCGCQVLPGTGGEKSTKGLDTLEAMCQEHYMLGCRFAKWRAVLQIDEEKGWPSKQAIHENAWGLARYAAICQDNGLVPIVEPEVIPDGKHGIEVCQKVTEKVLAECMVCLAENNIFWEGCLLKPNMITQGNDCPDKAPGKDIGRRTAQALSRTIPPALQGILFLSGGMSEDQASEYLNDVNNGKEENGEDIRKPWFLSFSYGRALQTTAVKTWAGKEENVKAAQEILVKRAKAHSEAQLGKFQGTDFGKDSNVEKGYTY